MIYLIIIFILFFSAMAETAGVNRKTEKVFQFFLVSMIILFIGLRYNTGYDYHAYSRFFDISTLNYKYYSEFSHWEIGYVLLNKTFKYIFGNYYVMQFAITAFVCIAVYRFIIRYSKYPLVSLCLFFTFFYAVLMSIVRQSIAMAIMIISTKYILNRKLLPFIIMTTLACMFHTSAICMIPLYFMNHNFGKKILIAVTIACPLLARAKEFMILILSLIVKILPLPARLSEIIIIYINSPRYSSSSLATNSGSYYLINIIIILFLYIFIIPKKNNSFFLNVLCLSLVFQSLSIAFYVFHRIGYYFSLFNVVTYTYLLTLINFKKLKEIFYIYSFIILLYFTLPYIATFTWQRNAISRESGYKKLYTLVPYYNSIYHPYKAQFRMPIDINNFAN
jgi:hypothetical protein